MSRKANPKKGGDKPEKVLEQLFTWAKSAVAGYPGVNLTNWEKSWQNGYVNITFMFIIFIYGDRLFNLMDRHK